MQTFFRQDNGQTIEYVGTRSAFATPAKPEDIKLQSEVENPTKLKADIADDINLGMGLVKVFKRGRDVWVAPERAA